MTIDEIQVQWSSDVLDVIVNLQFTQMSWDVYTYMCTNMATHISLGKLHLFIYLLSFI